MQTSNLNKLVSCIVIAVLGFTNAAIAGDDCAIDRVDIRSESGKVRFSVEVAQTFDERAIGLMHRETMGMFSGMLFVYEKPQHLVFWMRNTLISLDMLFIDENGIVRNIHANATPESDTSIVGGDDLKYVLEINAGMASRLGISTGAEIRHPLIDGEAVAWGCE